MYAVRNQFALMSRLLTARNSSALPVLLAAALSLGAATTLRAQQAPAIDAGVSFIAERSLKANTGQNFWMEGGSFEMGARLYKGLGIAMNLTGAHGNSIGTSGIPISMITTTFGPRYRFTTKSRWSPYGEVLVGESNVFHSLVPTPFGAQPEGNSLALHIGGGLDYNFRRRYAVRVLDASWIYTQIPNSTNNIQNSLRIGAGFVVRFGH